MFDQRIGRMRKLLCISAGLGLVLVLWVIALSAALVPRVLLPWPGDVGRALSFLRGAAIAGLRGAKGCRLV